MNSELLIPIAVFVAATCGVWAVVTMFSKKRSRATERLEEMRVDADLSSEEAWEFLTKPSKLVVEQDLPDGKGRRNQWVRLQWVAR